MRSSSHAATWNHSLASSTLKGSTFSKTNILMPRTTVPWKSFTYLSTIFSWSNHINEVKKKSIKSHRYNEAPSIQIPPQGTYLLVLCRRFWTLYGVGPPKQDYINIILPLQLYFWCSETKHARAHLSPSLSLSPSKAMWWFLLCSRTERLFNLDFSEEKKEALQYFTSERRWLEWVEG